MNLIAAVALLQQVVLTPAQQAKLTALGWPPAPPRVARRDDLVFLRYGGQAVTGSLTGLHAFATVATSHGDVRVQRDQIGMILVNGALIPVGAPVLPLDSDAVVLKTGAKATGRVEIDGDVIHVGARALRQSEVALIRLRDPQAAQQAQQASSASDGAPPSGQTQNPTRNPTGNPTGNPGNPASGGAPGGRPRPRGPNEIPWGQAVWRGVLRFSTVTSSLGETETGMYYVTMAESALGKPPYLPGVNLWVTSLVYQYQLTEPKIGSCAAFSFSKNGSGVDGWHPELRSGGIMSLPMPGMPMANNNDGGYHINLFTPVFVPEEEWPKVCSTGGPPTTAFPGGHPLPSLSFGQTSVGTDCTPSFENDRRTFRAPPPFTTIAGEVTCGTPGQYQYASLTWQFDRGVPPIDPTINQKPCETPEALLSLSRDQRQRAVDRLKQIAAEFAAAKQQEAQQRRTKDQLQPAFNLMIVAAAGSDLGTRLLEIAVSDGMLSTAAATGEISQAQREFIGNLNKFIKSYETWTKAAGDPSGWGEGQLIGQAKEGALGEGGAQVVDAAFELIGYGQVLADAIGQGDGSAALDYIEENLSKFGPLIPEYSINKARQYVEVSRQWSAALKTMARLSAEGANLAGQIAEADLGIQVRQQALDDCNRANPSK